MKVWDGSVWVDAYASLSGALLAANNLSDLNNTTTARSNLGLGSIATQAANSVAITGGTATLTSVTTPTVQATNSSGLALKNSAGTTQISMGSGGGDNVTVSAPIAITPVNGLVNIAPTGTGSVTINPATAGTINNMSIGATTASTGRFSDLTDTGLTSTRVIYATTGGNLTDSANLTFDGTTLTAAGLSDSGNLTFTGTGNRIRGDFTNATIANRVAFQSSTVNGLTNVGFIPNGTATDTALNVINNSDPTNASRLALSINAATDARIQSAISGTGTYLPLTMYTGGSERLRIDTSGNVGIGTSSPTSLLNLYSATVASLITQGDSATSINAQRNSTDASGANINIRKARGTTASPTAVASGDTLGGILFQGYGGTNTRNLGAVQAFVDTYTSDTNISSYLTFSNSSSGSASNTERMRITAAGNVGIGTSSPNYNLHINSASAASYLQFTNTGSGTTITDGFIIGNDANGANIIQREVAPMIFYTANLECMRIDSIGNVGIGTTSPNLTTSNKALTINASTAAGLSVLELSSGGVLNCFLQTNNAGTYFGSGTATPLQFYTNSGERMRIDSSGNVGIGVTSPVGKLDIISGAARMYFSNQSATAFFTAVDTTNSAYAPMAINGSVMILKTGDSERMRIDSSGNVGIGSTTPTVRLNVAGNQINYGTNPYIALSSAYNTTPAYLQYNTSTFECKLLNTGSSSNGFITFATGAGDERMRIDSNGNLLVGTTSQLDGERLLSYRSTDAVSAMFANASNTGSYTIQVRNYGTSGDRRLIRLMQGSTPSDCGAIYYNGTLTVYATTSDERLKKNISDSQSGISKLSNIKIRSFDWKESNTHTDFGVVAQELYEVAPEAVLKGDEGTEIKETWQVDVSTLVPAMIKAIQEQQILIEKLTTRLNALEGK